MGKEEVIEYVMTTPGNPNRAVLEGMLDEVSGTQLPSPTASDNGKVLGVSDGEYALVEQSGGGEAIEIKVVPNNALGGHLYFWKEGKVGHILAKSFTVNGSSTIYNAGTDGAGYDTEWWNLLAPLEQDVVAGVFADSAGKAIPMKVHPNVTADTGKKGLVIQPMITISGTVTLFGHISYPLAN